MKFESLKYHLHRLLFQAGRRLALGGKAYRVDGFFPNHLATDLGHEPFMTRLLEDLLKRDGAFIDVGANVGQTLLKVLAVDPHRQYLGFEPQVEACFNLQKFITRNNLALAEVFPFALSNKSGIVNLFANTDSDVMASIMGNEHRAGGNLKISHRILAKNGDEAINELEIEKIAIIKIDVEGAELNVLEGLKRTIDIHSPVLIFEILPNFHGADKIMLDEETRGVNSLNAERIFRYLIDLDYKIKVINELNGKLEPIDYFDLDDRDAYKGSNYIAERVPGGGNFESQESF